MPTKYSLFIVIAVYFVFSYPVITTTLNLNYYIGWHTRDWQTYLLPLWFLMIFLTYRQLSARQIEIPKYLFWFHLAISVVPSFFFNYPFIQTNFTNGSVEDALSKMNNIYLAFMLYCFVQVALFLFLFTKLFRK